MRNKVNFYLRDTFAILALVGATIFYFFPILQNPSGLITNDYDGALIAWTLKTVGDNIITAHSPFFDGTIFYPHQNTLAFSDLYLTDTILTLPIRLFTSEPVILFNAALILSQLLTLVFLYFVVHELTNHRLIALTASLAFGFSLIRLHYLGHLHTMSIDWVILALLALIKLTLIPSKPWLIVLFSAFVMQTANSFLPGYFVLFTGMFFLFLPRLRHHLTILMKEVVMGVIVSGILLAPIISAYVHVSKTYDYVRPITDSIHFALSLEEIISTFFSPGLYFFIIVGLVALSLPKQVKGARQYLMMGLTATVMALGPALKWSGQTIKIPFHVPLPYFFMYYLIPGFQGFRTPSRWIVMAGLAFTVGAALLWKRWPESMKQVLLTGTLILILFNSPPLNLVAIPSQADYPQAYYILRELPLGPVLELPIFRWGYDVFSKNETWRMLYQSYHKQPLVNGYSGFSPPEWEQMVATMQTAPDIPWELIKQQGVKYVLIHEDEYRRWGKPLPPEWQQTALIHEFREMTRTNDTVVMEY